MANVGNYRAKVSQTTAAMYSIGENYCYTSWYFVEKKLVQGL